MKIVWGVDPGIARIGISVLAVEEHRKKLLNLMLIDLTEVEEKGRLGALAKATSFFVDVYPPDIVGMEKLLWGRNVTTALNVAEARGVLKYIFDLKGATIVECLPRVVKASVGASLFGKGKNAVRQAVMELYGAEIATERLPWHAIIDDVIDSVAIALAVVEGDC